jgi:hypothetical protein
MTTEADPTGTPPPPPSPGSGSFSQEDLNRIAAKEKDEGKRAGERAVLEALGFQTAADAKAFFDKVKEEEKAKLSEADRKMKEAEEKERKADAKALDAAQRERNALISAELVEAGVPKAQVKFVAKMVEVDEADEEKIAQAVKDLKKAMPNLFVQDGKPPPPGSHPAPPPKNTGNQQTPADQAKDILYERHPRLKEAPNKS